MISRSSAATSVSATGTLALSSGVTVTAAPTRMLNGPLSVLICVTGAGLDAFAIARAASVVSSEGLP
jgi:hypothetical protein